MEAFGLEPWLASRSVRTERRHSEIVFTHFTGETSILVPRTLRTEPLVEVNVASLSSFFLEYSGASIGNGHIILGTNVVGGISTSHGFKLPDLIQMREEARKLGVVPSSGEQVFMMAAAWMFIYTLEQKDGKETLRKYDRDYAKNRVVESFGKVLEVWWKIVTEDHY